GGQRATGKVRRAGQRRPSLLNCAFTWIYSADGRPCDHFGCPRRDAGWRGDVLETRGPPGWHATAASDLRSPPYGKRRHLSATQRADGQLGDQGGPRPAAAARYPRGRDRRPDQPPRLRGQRAPFRGAAPLPGPSVAVRAVTDPVRSGPEVRPRRR